MTNVVIGAGSGMGGAVAPPLAPRGRLLLADQNPTAAEATAAELGGDVQAVGCDITDQPQIDALFSAVDELDALVSTAGVSGSMAPGRRILEVNLIGTARVLRAAEPLLDPGSVAVCVASQSGYMVPENRELFELLEEPLADGFLDKLGTFFDLDQPGL